MSIFSAMKAQKAYRLQQKGQKEEAIRLYEEAFQEGVNDTRYNLAYALLIIRDGQYQKAKDFLVAHQKTPGMTQEQRTTLLVDYAACCLKLGDADKGIRTLEQQFRKTQTGLLYQTLGYLYVDKYDREHRPDFDALRAEAARSLEASAGAAPEEGEAAEPPAGEADGEPAEGEQGTAPEAPVDPEEAWNAKIDEAEAFLKAAVEYDEEDPICLDNMGQFLYRVRGDRAGAKPWFEKALAIKDTQIDTLYFLSRYDEEAGDRASALARLEKAAGGRFSPLNYCTLEALKKEIERLKGA